MRARVTNLGRGARGLLARDGSTVMVEPGASATISLADHPAHAAWIESGEVTVAAEDEPDAARPAAPKDRASPRGPGPRSR